MPSDPRNDALRAEVLKSLSDQIDEELLKRYLTGNVPFVYPTLVNTFATVNDTAAPFSLGKALVPEEVDEEVQELQQCEPVNEVEVMARGVVEITELLQQKRQARESGAE